MMNVKGLTNCICFRRASDIANILQFIISILPVTFFMSLKQGDTCHYDAVKSATIHGYVSIPSYDEQLLLSALETMKIK